MDSAKGHEVPVATLKKEHAGFKFAVSLILTMLHYVNVAKLLLLSMVVSLRYGVCVCAVVRPGVSAV